VRGVSSARVRRQQSRKFREAGIGAVVRI
jgi:hypothetical protein